ncbi:hypothetical protein CEUSTIGMA_g6914.t1 [Chlamydomonas eustigma]|uniref:ShKT domain-containing protein n=1 Tax=Chlamydomonas eustigma TaxID=1157962 RepID=A0A250X8S4_9CHLO|nr:hypothetical protein CEUSTIGMA_g6914.t1 [Chlamydomonas eustigma]|eukprot:GAX79473.1 hypothetical protein CEUSTIGMA_g6914.t1 [Chlamydomonas eustigma]
MFLFKFSILIIVCVHITMNAAEHAEAPMLVQGDNTTGVVLLSDADVSKIAESNHSTALLGLEIDNTTSSSQPLPVIPLLIMVQPLINGTKKGKNHTAKNATHVKKFYYFQLNNTETQSFPFIIPEGIFNHSNNSQLGSHNLTNVTIGPHAYHSHHNKTYKPLQTSSPTPVAVNPSSFSQRLETCTDTPPSQVFTCQQQKDFGKCDADFMVKYNYCARTCSRAPCPQCSDTVPPGSNITCEQQKAYGKCAAEWMVSGAYCTQTCQAC